jgi:hypothetical protein
MKKHLATLLQQQLDYWKQMGKIKWVTLGDENSKFLHSIASSKNHIATIIENIGVPVIDHTAKATLLLQAYKERLGQSENISSLSPFAHLLNNNGLDLVFLEAPFTHDEIDAVIKDFPNNKSLGPDGFNAEFLRKCWPIIKKDLYYMCDQFHQGNLCLQSINSCYITLVPKKDNAETVHDFRPMSLLNCTLKLITKLLANSLQTVIQSIIHENQYGFIKSRTIQDCLA